MFDWILLCSLSFLIYARPECMCNLACMPLLARCCEVLSLESSCACAGGDVGAREARLSIMVGGNKSAFDAVTPLFNLMGKNIRHMGVAGKGQHTKMVNQILIASNMIGVVEGLLYAHKAGLDMDEAIAAVGAGAAGSWSINNLGAWVHASCVPFSSCSALGKACCHPCVVMSLCARAGPRIVKRNFDPGFFVEHFVKDMGIALSEAKR